MEMKLVRYVDVSLGTNIVTKSLITVKFVIEFRRNPAILMKPSLHEEVEDISAEQSVKCQLHNWTHWRNLDTSINWISVLLPILHSILYVKFKAIRIFEEKKTGTYIPSFLTLFALLSDNELIDTVVIQIKLLRDLLNKYKVSGNISKYARCLTSDLCAS